jgi:hypothetical protein
MPEFVDDEAAKNWSELNEDAALRRGHHSSDRAVKKRAQLYELKSSVYASVITRCLKTFMSINRLGF